MLQIQEKVKFTVYGVNDQETIQGSSRKNYPTLGNLRKLQSILSFNNFKKSHKPYKQVLYKHQKCNLPGQLMYLSSNKIY